MPLIELPVVEITETVSQVKTATVDTDAWVAAMLAT